LSLPELVLLDIGMPGMDGYEVARQLRTEFDSSLTIVALTGWGSEQDRQRSRNAGFDRHLTKPVDLAALEAALAGPQLVVSR
jgi:CheY-like chemotaxis protein